MDIDAGATVDQMRRRVRSCVGAGRVLGAALAVVRAGDDEALHAEGFGTTSAEPEDVPVTPATLFAAASLSKVILATLIMRLVERGALALDEPVLTYLPGFAFSDPELGRRMTLRHLLSHTSGLPAAGKDWGPCGPDALRRFVWEQLPHYAFIAPPGRVYQYANTAVCLAGHVAEAAAGGRYRDLVREHVLAPLAMSRTTYDHAVAMTYRLALPHEADAAGRVRTVHRWADNASGDPSGFAIAPVVDLARLALVLLNRGRVRGRAFLAERSVTTMRSQHGDRHVAAASHPVAHLEEGYGLGLALGTYRGARVVRHGGVLQSFNNFFQLLPDVGFGFVLLTNYGDEAAVTALVLGLHDDLLGLPTGRSRDRAVLLPAAPDPPDRERWRRYAGTYLNVHRGRLATVRVRAGRLELEQGGRTRRLVPVAAGAYFYEAEGLRVPVEFLPGDPGAGEGAAGEEGGLAAAVLFVGGHPYGRAAADPGPAPDPASWARFVGLYRDPSNLGEGAVWRIGLEGGRLRIAGDWADDECTPLGATSFLSSIGLLEFDAAGEVLRVGQATRYFKVPPA